MHILENTFQASNSIACKLGRSKRNMQISAEFFLGDEGPWGLTGLRPMHLADFLLLMLDLL